VSSEAWFGEVRALLTDRPASWATLASKTPGKLHPIEVFRALQPHVGKHPDTVLIRDGGEFAHSPSGKLGLSLTTLSVSVAATHSNTGNRVNGQGYSLASDFPVIASAAKQSPSRDAPRWRSLHRYAPDTD
jgi:hypothetical protein